MGDEYEKMYESFSGRGSKFDGLESLHCNALRLYKFFKNSFISSQETFS